MQFLVGRLQFLIRGGQFLVGRLQFFVGGLHLFDGRLQVLLGVTKFVFQFDDPLPLDVARVDDRGRPVRRRRGGGGRRFSAGDDLD